MEELGNRKQWEKYIERFLMRRKGRNICKKHTNRNAAKHRITTTFSFKNTHKNNYLPSTLDKVWMRTAFSLSESILVMISIWKKTSKRNSSAVKKIVLSACIHLSFSFAQKARDWLSRWQKWKPFWSFPEWQE